MAGSRGNNRDNDFEESLRQFVDASMRGEEPDIDELVGQFPEYEDQIRQKLQSFRKIDALFDTIVQPKENELEDSATEGDLVGQRIGGFEIVEIIGRGGMGIVYLAHDTKLKRSVAVKSIPAALVDDSTARMRFKREAVLLASLNHPNIAVIYEIIEKQEDTDYLVLEYVPGDTLAQRIGRKPLKFEEALSIGRQIVEAVSAAHEKGIIHRDLKPANIKIMPDGRVKVLDFGLAKASASVGKPADATVTQAGHVMGTPTYMSPEQARGKDTDYRTDIWSFGCIMYEMLTNQVPFEGETATDTIARVLERQPDWDALPPETPANIRVLLQRCLEKDPNQRLDDITNAAIEINETLSKLAITPPTTISAKQRKRAMIIGAATVIVVFSIVLLFFLKKQPSPRPSPKEIRLVVLPFENLGPFEEEYFASGVTDAIIARLAGLQKLAVISRQSAIQYKNSKKSAQEIGKELGVDYILEGTVQRERSSDPNSAIRIIPQLIRAKDDTHVWSNIYDNNVSEIFRLQSDVAERVAQALDVTLLEPERQALTTRLTESTEAYEYYLRGNEYVYRSIHENDLRIAIQMYEKAIEFDPEFALAYGELSRAHVRMYWHYYDRNDARLIRAKEAIDKAIQLNPDLPEVQLALGHYYYQGHMDYEHALEQFEKARKGQPSNSEIIYFIAAVQRRQGKIEQAFENFQRAAELDPRSGRLAEETGDTLMRARRYTEAEQYLERAIWLAPHTPEPYERRAMLYLICEGRTDRARAVLQKGLQNVDSTSPKFNDLLVKLYIYDRNYQKALDQLSLKPEDIDTYSDYMPIDLQYAEIYGYMNKNELANKHYESARNIMEIKVQQQPEDARLHSSLGIAYAGLGQKQEAIREGLFGIELLPVTKDAWRGPFRVEDLAQIYVMVEEHKLTIEKLEYLLSIPGEMSVPLLKLDPAWAPVNYHPHFKKLSEPDK